MGSPPHVREVFIYGTPTARGIRITPAFAGSMHFRLASFSVGGDHPRVCGKYQYSSINSYTSKGSPPRLREVFEETDTKGGYAGITPACAGSIVIRLDRFCVNWDHPRVCGKYLQALKMVTCMLGSPPRVREVFAPDT